MYLPDLESARSRSCGRARTGRAAAQTTRLRPPGDCGDSAAAHAEDSFMSKCRIGRGGAGGGTSRRTSGCALGRQQARKALVTPRAHPGAATPLVATPRSPVSLERRPCGSPTAARAIAPRPGRTRHGLRKGYVGVLQSISPRFIGPSAGPVRSHSAQCRSAVAALHRRAGSSTSIPRRSSSRT